MFHRLQRIMRCCPSRVQLHLVHWNEDLYDSFEEAVKREDGIVIVAVFLKVIASSYRL